MTTLRGRVGSLEYEILQLYCEIKNNALTLFLIQDQSYY